MTIKRVGEVKNPSEGVEVSALVDVWEEGGKEEEMDTEIVLQGRFSVSGSTRNEFYEKLGDLIDAYRI